MMLGYPSTNLYLRIAKYFLKLSFLKIFLWNKYYEIKLFINSERKKKLADGLTKFSNRNKKNNSFENQVFFLIIKNTDLRGGEVLS